MLLELDAGVCAVTPERRILGVQLNRLCVEIGGIVELVVCRIWSEARSRTVGAALGTHDHVLRNALFANVLIRAASAFASSDGSGRSRGFSGGEPGADVGGVVAEGEERPETDEELMVVKV